MRPQREGISIGRRHKCCKANTSPDRHDSPAVPVARRTPKPRRWTRLNYTDLHGTEQGPSALLACCVALGGASAKQQALSYTSNPTARISASALLFATTPA